MTPEKFKKLCERIVHRSDELESNSRMWFRGRNAWLRIYNSSMPQERALAHAVRALVHYQLVILYSFWETPRSHKNTASLPLALGRETHKNAEDIASSIVEQTSFRTADHANNLKKKRREIQRICEITELSEQRFKSIITTIRLARNKAIAHNSTQLIDESINVFELRWLSSRTARICRMAAKIHDGPLSVSVMPHWRLQKKSIDEFWSLLEGDRADASSEDQKISGRALPPSSDPH